MNHDVTTLDGLYTIANELCRKYWGVDYTGTIELVKRDWKWKGAHYDPEKLSICMSKKKNNRMGAELTVDCLLHELVHWRLHSTGQPYYDEDAEFISEALRIGAIISYEKSARKAYYRYLRKNGIEEVAI